MCKKRWSAVLLVFMMVFSCLSVYANEEALEGLADIAEQLTADDVVTAEYEYIPIQHEETIVNIREEEEDLKPIKPSYVVNSDSLTEKSSDAKLSAGNIAETDSADIAVASIEDGVFWNDVFSQAYGESYFSPYMKYGDSIRTAENSNKLIIENTDLTLKGKNGMDVVLKRRYDNQYTNDVYYGDRYEGEFTQYSYLYRFIASGYGSIYISFKSTDQYYEYMYNKPLYVSKLPDKTKKFHDKNSSEYIGYFFEDIYALKSDTSTSICLTDSGSEPINARYTFKSSNHLYPIILNSPAQELGQGWILTLPDACLNCTDDVDIDKNRTKDYTGSFRTLTGEVFSMSGSASLDKSKEPARYSSSIRSDDARFYPELFYERQQKDGIEYDCTIYDAYNGYTYYYYAVTRNTVYSMRIVAIYDEYNNRIKYDYTDNDCKSKLAKITDTYNNEILFTYSSSENSMSETTTISYHDGTFARNIVYKKELLPSSVLNNDSLFKGKSVSKFSVTNQENETTEYYSREAEPITVYSWSSAEHSIDVNQCTDTIFYTSTAYNIEKIVYPTGKISEYNYAHKYYRFNNLKTYTSKYALVSSYDRKPNDSINKYNAVTYTVSGTTGIANKGEVKVSEETEKGLTHKKTYNYDGLLINDVKYNGGTDYSSDKYTYFSKGSISKQIHKEQGVNVTTEYEYSSYESTKRNYPIKISDGKKYIEYTYHTKGNFFTGIPSQIKTYKGTSKNHILDYTTNITLDENYSKIVSEEIVKDGETISRTDYTYTSEGEIASVSSLTDGNDSVTKNYTYSPDGRSVTVGMQNVSDADGNSKHITEEYRLNKLGMPVSYIDPDRRMTLIAYDGAGRVHRRNNDDGSNYIISYYISDNYILTVNEVGLRTRYNYDELGNLVSVQYQSGGEWITLSSCIYDNYGRMLQKTSYSSPTTGTREEYTYDPYDRPVTCMVYDISDNTLKYTNSYKYASTYTYVSTVCSDGTSAAGEREDYDSYGRVTKRYKMLDSSVSESFVSYAYDYLDRVISETDAKGNATSYTYDTLGNLLTTTFADETSVSNTYDMLGRKISSTDANGVTTNTIYDSLGRVIKTVYSIDSGKNGMVKYYYDGNGNLVKQMTQSNKISVETPSFDVAEYEYDGRNNMVKSTQYASGENDPQITQYYYDETGNVLRMYTGLTSPLEIYDLDDYKEGADTSYSTFKYEYDKLGRLIKFTDALGNEETYTCDYAGNVLTKTDRDGYIVTTAYNWQGKPVSMTSDKDNTTVTYTYDVLGNRKTMTDSTGTTAYTYDNLSRLTSETTSTGYTKAYTYDKNNNVLSFILSDENDTIISSTYTYDSLNRMTTASNNGITEAYTYDNNGNLTKRENPAFDVLNSYNKANWQTRAKTLAIEAADILGYYNYNGTMTRTSEMYYNLTDDDFLTDYTYDGLKRLTSEVMEAEEGSSVSSYSNTYAYDDRSNRVSKNNGYSTQNYEYDDNNRMLTTDDGYDCYYYDNGNLSADGTYAYVYDGFNRLTEVRDFYNYNNIPASYTYNGDGQRVSKTVDGVTTTYVWNGDNIVYEHNGTSGQTYLYGQQLYAMEGYDGNTYYYSFNGHGDVSGLHNETGGYVRTYHYDAFGNQRTANAGDTNPFRYCGEYYDSETGLIYLRNRYYNTNTGRFITEDPIRDGLNWYVYCGNNPVMFSDSSGLKPSLAAAAAMASHIYKDIPLSDNSSLEAQEANRADRTVKGWRLIDYYTKGSLKIGVYIPDNDDWQNPSEYSLVFKGTTPTSGEDWENNAQQYLGEYSTHLAAGLVYAGYFVKAKSDYEITFIGHSKGGGEAAVNAEFWNKNAIVFNPSVPDITWALADEGYVQPYVVRGDILNHYLGEMPLGKTIYFEQQHNGWLPGISITDRINNHSMSSVLSAIKKGAYE